MSVKTFLDTNILVYAHDKTYPNKMAKAQELIFQGLRTKQAAISAQVLSEFFVTITQKAKKPMTIELARREIEMLANLEIAEIDASMVLRAIAIKQRWQLNYWDSLIIAAAERTKCSMICSEDFSDGQRFGTIVIRNPFV
jgi:predicted nucleic acid-binding protein